MVQHFRSGHLSCGDCQIRARAVCAQADAGELAALERIKYYRSFPAGQTVVWADDKMDFVGSIVSGTATLTKTLEDGRRQMVGMLQPSDFVGRPGRSTAAFDVAAATDLVMCCFRKKPFEDLMVRTPHIISRLLAMTLDELDAAREWMLILGRKTAREKIASLLGVLARRASILAPGAPRNDVAFELPLTREAMADYLGLTIETVSRQITALKKDDVIRITGNRSIAIPDLARLLREASDDKADAATL